LKAALLLEVYKAYWV